MEGMDRIIEKKKFGKKQLAIAGLLVLALGSLPLIITGRTSKLRIDKDKVSVGKVMLDKYQDFISVNGTVEPMTTVFLDAVESGRVERILLEEGTRVKEGDIIMEVSNYNLLLDISGNEADVSRAINDLKTARMSLENQSIQTRARMLELEYQLKKLEREINRNEELFAASLLHGRL
jgi:HlyD family secretion protein